MILSANEWEVMVVGWDAMVHKVVFVRAGKGEGWAAEVSMMGINSFVRSLVAEIWCE